MKIYVVTSNKYIRCVPPFAYLFNKFWPGENVTVVCYNKKPGVLPENFTLRSIGKQRNYTWSSGIRKCLLEDTDNDLFLLMLEDYFLDQHIDITFVESLYAMMVEQDAIMKIDLTNDRLKVPYERITDVLIRSRDDALFQMSLQAALWRKSFMLEFLRDTEGPWAWEKQGTKRLIQARENGWRGLVLGTTVHPVHYVNAVGGRGTHPGQWDIRKFPDWMRIELRRKGLL